MAAIKKLRAAVGKSRLKKHYTNRRHKVSMWKGDFKNYVKNDPFPPRRNYKLTYTQNYPFAADGVLTNVFGVENVFSLNSLFDPDITAVGHQPYGFDQLTLLYRKYKVYGVTITVRFSDPTADGQVCGAMITAPGSVTTLAAQTLTSAIEKPFVATKVINNTGSQSATIRQFIPMYKAIGVTKLEFDANTEDFTGDTAGPSPVQQPKLRVAAANTAVAGIACNAQITLEYHAAFWDRKVLPQS